MPITVQRIRSNGVTNPFRNRSSSAQRLIRDATETKRARDLRRNASCKLCQRVSVSTRRRAAHAIAENGGNEGVDDEPAASTARPPADVRLGAQSRKSNKTTTYCDSMEPAHRHAQSEIEEDAIRDLRLVSGTAIDRCWQGYRFYA